MGEEMKVGELARRSGVSIRTLHYYEEIGLLEPHRRTAAGHRLYAEAEILRLQQVRSLVQLGFSLEEVHRCFEQPDYSPEQVLHLQMARLDEEIEQQRRLRQRLGTVTGRLQAAEKVSADELLDVIREIEMLEKHYTPEQLAELEKRAEALGPEGMKKAEADWARLLADVREARAQGLAPDSDAVLVLARRWKALVEQFTGGDPGIHRSLDNLYREDHAQLQQQHGDCVPTAEDFQYIGQAVEILGSKAS